MFSSCWDFYKSYKETYLVNYGTNFNKLYDVKLDRLNELIKDLAFSIYETNKDYQLLVEKIGEVIQNYQNPENFWASNTDGWIIKVTDYSLTSITTLLKVIETSQDKNVRILATNSLCDIVSNQPILISTLLELMENSQDQNVRLKVTNTLCELDPINPIIISTLVDLIQNSQNESICLNAVEMLGSINKDHPILTLVLIKLIENTQDEYIRLLAASSLGKIDKRNPMAITTLRKSFENNKSEYIRSCAAGDLEEIAQNELWELYQENPLIFYYIGIDLEQNIENQNRLNTAWDLAQLENEASVVVYKLLEFIKNFEDKYTRRQVKQNLKEILVEAQTAAVVTTLKYYLSDETYNNDFNRFSDCYEVIWHCAQNMSYPDFYQAWEPDDHSVEG